MNTHECVRAHECSPRGHSENSQEKICRLSEIQLQPSILFYLFIFYFSFCVSFFHHFVVVVGVVHVHVANILNSEPTTIPPIPPGGGRLH